MHSLLINTLKMKNNDKYNKTQKISEKMIPLESVCIKIVFILC